MDERHMLTERRSQFISNVTERAGVTLRALVHGKNII